VFQRVPGHPVGPSIGVSFAHLRTLGSQEDPFRAEVYVAIHPEFILPRQRKSSPEMGRFKCADLGGPTNRT